MPPKNIDPRSISHSDLEKYRAELADLDISDEEKNQLIHILSEMMRAFVDIAWDTGSGGDFHATARDFVLAREKKEKRKKNKREKRATKASGTPQAKQPVRPSPTSIRNRVPATELSPVVDSSKAQVGFEPSDHSQELEKQGDM